MARPYPRDKATAERILTLKAAMTYRWLWSSMAADDEDDTGSARWQLSGILSAAESLGLDADKINVMAQRYNSLSPQEVSQEYGDLLEEESSE